MDDWYGIRFFTLWAVVRTPAASPQTLKELAEHWGEERLCAAKQIVDDSKEIWCRRSNGHGGLCGTTLYLMNEVVAERFGQSSDPFGSLTRGLTSS